MKHYIIRKDGVVQSYPFKNEKKFRANYVRAPRRRVYERRFGKRVRVWRRKLEIVKPPVGRYYKIVISYEGRVHGTWNIVGVYSRFNGDPEAMMKDFRKEIMKAMGWNGSWIEWEDQFGNIVKGTWEVDGVDEGPVVEAKRK